MVFFETEEPKIPMFQFPIIPKSALNYYVNSCYSAFNWGIDWDNLNKMKPCFLYFNHTRTPGKIPKTTACNNSLRIRNEYKTHSLDSAFSFHFFYLFLTDSLPRRELRRWFWLKILRWKVISVRSLLYRFIMVFSFKIDIIKILQI